MRAGWERTRLADLGDRRVWQTRTVIGWKIRDSLGVEILRTDREPPADLRRLVRALGGRIVVVLSGVIREEAA